MGKIGRNAPCPCGSGKKYKKCCLKKEERQKDEHRREMKTIKETEKTSAREKEELFEPFPVEPDDDYESGYEDDYVEEEDGGEKPKRRKIEIPRIKWEVGEISESEEQLIEDWYEKFWEMKKPDEIRNHLENFIAEHPALVDNLELHNEALFYIFDTFTDNGLHSEAIELFEKIRRDYPETYKQKYGFFDLYLVAYRIATGKKDEIPTFLNYFITYPDHEPDELFELIDLLKMNNCIEILEDFIFRIYAAVCESRKIFGGGAILDTVLALCFSRFIKPGYTRRDIEQLSENLSGLDVAMDEDAVSPESLEKDLSQMFAKPSAWSIDDCLTREKLVDRYREVAKNFWGYLVEHTAMDWTAADFHMQMAFKYLIEVAPPKKRPNKAFVFSKALIDTTATKLSRDIIGVHSVKFIGILNAIYYFADYLYEADSVSAQLRDDIKKWCEELYDFSFPNLLKSRFEAIAFREFPIIY